LGLLRLALSKQILRHISHGFKLFKFDELSCFRQSYANKRFAACKILSNAVYLLKPYRRRFYFPLKAICLK